LHYNDVDAEIDWRYKTNSNRRHSIDRPVYLSGQSSMCITSQINADLYQDLHGEMPFGLSLVCASGLDGKLFDIATLAETAFKLG
jgi:hypothetical protein